MMKCDSQVHPINRDKPDMVPVLTRGGSVCAYECPRCPRWWAVGQSPTELAELRRIDGEARRAANVARRKPIEDALVTYVRQHPGKWVSEIEGWSFTGRNRRVGQRLDTDAPAGTPTTRGTLTKWLRRLQAQGRVMQDDRHGWHAVT